MRYILTLLLSAIISASYGQVTLAGSTKTNTVRVQGNFDFDSLTGRLRLPLDTLASAVNGSFAQKGGKIWLKDAGYWKQAGGGSIKAGNGITSLGDSVILGGGISGVTYLTGAPGSTFSTSIINSAADGVGGLSISGGISADVEAELKTSDVNGNTSGVRLAPRIMELTTDSILLRMATGSPFPIATSNFDVLVRDKSTHRLKGALIGQISPPIDTTTRNTGIPNFGRSIYLADSIAKQRVSDSLRLTGLQQVTSVGDSTSNRLVTSRFVKSDSIRSNFIESKYLLQVGDSAIRTNDTVFFYGNSITQGIGATSSYYNWVSTFSRLLGVTPINRGISGTTAQFVSGTSLDSAFENRINGLPYYRSTYRYIFLSYFTNDSRNAVYDTTTGKSVVSRGIDTLVARGWPLDRIVINSLVYWNDGLAPTLGSRRAHYFSAAQTLAAARGVRFVDVYNPIRLNSARASTADSLHLTNFGHQLYANTVISTLSQPTQGLLQVFGKGNFSDNISVGAQMAFAPTSYPAAINTGSSYGVLPTDYKLYLLGLNGGIGVTSAGVNYGITNTSNNRHTFYGTGGLYVQDGNLFVRPVTGNVSSASPAQLNLGTTFANTSNDDTKMKVFIYGGTGLGISAQGFEFFAQAGSFFRFRRAIANFFRSPESDTGYWAGRGLAGSMARPSFWNLGTSFADEVNKPTKAKGVLYGTTDADIIGFGAVSAGLELFTGTAARATIYGTIAYPNAPAATAVDTTIVLVRGADNSLRASNKTAFISNFGLLSSSADAGYVKLTTDQTVAGKKTFSDSLKPNIVAATGNITTTGNMNAVVGTYSGAVQSPQLLATGGAGEMFITNAGSGVALRNSAGTPSSKVYQELQINRSGTVALLPDIRDTVNAILSSRDTSISVSTLTTSLTVPSGYRSVTVHIHSTSQCTVTLPATVAEFSTVAIVGEGAGGFKIQTPSGQTITSEMGTTTAGLGHGLTASNRYDAILLACTIFNSNWNIRSMQGTFTIY